VIELKDDVAPSHSNTKVKHESLMIIDTTDFAR